MANRVQRERDLMVLLSSPVGRNELLTLLRQQMQVPASQPLPLGTPIVQTILDYEFSDKSQAS